jgi:hypothetical protein
VNQWIPTRGAVLACQEAHMDLPCAQGLPAKTKLKLVMKHQPRNVKSNTTLAKKNKLDKVATIWKRIEYEKGHLLLPSSLISYHPYLPTSSP